MLPCDRDTPDKCRKGKMMSTQSEIILIAWFLFCFPAMQVYSQPGFAMPDTMCIDDSMEVTGLRDDASSYFWDFCSGSLGFVPVGDNLTDIGQVNGPAFIDLVKTSEGYYSFITNHVDGTLTRNKYGDKPEGSPVTVNLGKLGGLVHLEGIQIVQDGDQWYGFVTGGIGNASSLIRLTFGTSLDNTPAVTNLGNIGELNYPIDLFMNREGGIWTGLTVNYTDHTLTRLTFAQGLDNPPQGENLGNTGRLDQPCGLHALVERGEWFAFITNFGSHTVTRLHFGSSLSNTPLGINIGGSGVLNSPFDITIVRDCEHTFGFVVNHYANELIRLDFGNDLAATPGYESLGNIGIMDQPHGLSPVYREGNSLYLLIANINNTLTRLHFLPCDHASPGYYDGKNPPKVTYDQPGMYNVSLLVDEGSPTRELYCQNVLAFRNPDVSLGNDTSLLPGTHIELSPGDHYRAYEWSTGRQTASILVDEGGTYAVVATDTNSCRGADDILVTKGFKIPEFFSPNGDGINDTWEVPYFRTHPGATIEIYDRFGRKIIQYRGRDPGWDGTYRGEPAGAGTYWYVITFDDGSPGKKGHVTLIR